MGFVKYFFKKFKKIFKAHKSLYISILKLNKHYTPKKTLGKYP